MNKSDIFAIVWTGLFFLFAVWCGLRAGKEKEYGLSFFFFAFAMGFEGILIYLA